MYLGYDIKVHLAAIFKSETVITLQYLYHTYRIYINLERILCTKDRYWIDFISHFLETQNILQTVIERSDITLN